MYVCSAIYELVGEIGWVIKQLFTKYATPNSARITYYYSRLVDYLGNQKCIEFLSATPNIHCYNAVTASYADVIKAGDMASVSNALKKIMGTVLESKDMLEFGDLNCITIDIGGSRSTKRDILASVTPNILLYEARYRSNP